MPDTLEQKGTHRWIGGFILEHNGVSVEPGGFFSPSEEDLKDPAMKEFVASGFLLDLSKSLPKDDEGGDK